MNREAESDRIAELEDDNQRLRVLLERSSDPRELRHRARNNLGMIRAIIRKSAASGRSLDDYAAHLEDRLDSIGRVQANADINGFVDLYTLIADELLFYHVSESEHLSINGPALRFHPRAGQLFALAIHELAVNAVEYGAIARGTPLQIKWSISSDEGAPWLTFVWHENGFGERIEPSRQGFGTEVLTQMLIYDLKADTRIAFDQGGLRCQVRLPITDDIGIVIHE